MSQLREVRISFGRWIKTMREQLRISQEAAGLRANLSRIQWARIEAGAGTKPVTVVAMAKALGLPEKEALERAGYSAGLQAEENKDSLLLIHFRSLPEEIQESVSKQIELLAQHYLAQGKGPRGKLQIVSQGKKPLQSGQGKKKK